MSESDIEITADTCTYKGVPLSQLSHADLLIACVSSMKTIQTMRKWHQEEREMHDLFDAARRTIRGPR